MRPNVIRSYIAVFLLLACALAAAPAAAWTTGGCNLRWDHCYGDGGVANRNFACDTNTGTDFLIASVVPPADIVSVGGMEFMMHFAADAATMPAWWHFKNAGTCRQASIGGSTAPLDVFGACPDWSDQLASGGIASYTIGEGSPNAARLVGVTGLPDGASTNLTGLTEYFLFRLIVQHAKTVGSGACAGCETPVCIVFNTVNVKTTNAASHWIQGPANLTDSDYATWQGGGAPVTGRGTGCPAATPTRRSTWGAVKTLYH